MVSDMPYPKIARLSTWILQVGLGYGFPQLKPQQIMSYAGSFLIQGKQEQLQDLLLSGIVGLFLIWVFI